MVKTDAGQRSPPEASADDLALRRLKAAADIAALALERGTPHHAILAARDAVRSTLVALDGGTRRPVGEARRILVDFAALEPVTLAGHPAAGQAAIRLMLSALHRIIPPGGTPAHGRAAPHPGAPRRSP